MTLSIQNKELIKLVYFLVNFQICGINSAANIILYRSPIIKGDRLSKIEKLKPFKKLN